MRRGGVGDVRCKQAEALRSQRQRLSMHPEQTIFQRQCGLPSKLSSSLPFLSLQAIRLVCRPDPSKGSANWLPAVSFRASSLYFCWLWLGRQVGGPFVAPVRHFFAGSLY